MLDLFTLMAMMGIRQALLTGATNVEVGTGGFKRTFDLRKLQGEFTIVFKYFIKSPQVEAARSSLALTQRGLIPDRAIRRDTLQREDPEGDERWLRWEEAEHLSPAIKMNRTILALTEMAEKGDKHAGFEAELMSAEMGVNLQQMLAGETAQQPKPEEDEKPKPLVPIFGSSRGGGGGAPGKGEGGG